MKKQMLATFYDSPHSTSLSETSRLFRERLKVKDKRFYPPDIPTYAIGQKINIAREQIGMFEKTGEDRYLTEAARSIQSITTIDSSLSEDYLQSLISYVMIVYFGNIENVETTERFYGSAIRFGTRTRKIEVFPSNVGIRLYEIKNQKTGHTVMMFVYTKCFYNFLASYMNTMNIDGWTELLDGKGLACEVFLDHEWKW